MCNEAGVHYEFKKLKSGFVVCFYRSKEKGDKVRISTDKVRYIKSVSEKIVDYLLDNKRITNKEIQQLLGVKDSRALKGVKEMVEKDILIKHGKNRGSYYTSGDNEE